MSDTKFLVKLISCFILSGIFLSLPSFFDKSSIHLPLIISQTIELVIYFIGTFFGIRSFFMIVRAVEIPDEETNIDDVEDKSIVKTEFCVPNSKKEFCFNLDFKNKELNDKIATIEKTINSICSFSSTEKDSDDEIIIESIKEKYVKEVYDAYDAIPYELRKEKINNNTAFNLAMEQLEIIQDGLLVVQNQLLDSSLKNLHITNRFLMEKFSKKTDSKCITVNV